MTVAQTIAVGDTDTGKLLSREHRLPWHLA
jgi:hypothetical protein